MKWFTRLASPPPSYLAERIKDLAHARELCMTEPLRAEEVLKQVATHLETHLNPYFADKVSQIIIMRRDCAPKAVRMIDFVMLEMRSSDK
jgi:hypothetical protein